MFELQEFGSRVTDGISVDTLDQDEVIRLL